MAVALLVAAAGCSDQETPVAPTAAEPAPLLSVKDAIEGSYIVVLKDGGDPRSVAAVAGVQPRYLYKAALTGFAATLNEGQVEAVRRNPNVEYVTQDGRVTGTATQSNPPWGLDRIDQRTIPLNNQFIYTTEGAGVRVYVLDTGIRTTHVQFDTARASVGYDAFGGTGQDCNGHGTHVAGTIGGTTYGVAKKASLVSVRVLDCSGNGAWSGVIAGMDWVAANHVKPAVANMSLGGGANLAVDDAVDRLHAAGVAVVVASGNENQSACNVSPARAANAITVGATTSTDARWSTSNWGSCLDLFAPGVDIVSAGIGSNTATATLSGTSMAAPHVAGVAAMYLQRNPSATPADVATALFAGATAGTLTSTGTGSPNRLLYSLRVAPTMTGPATISTTGTYTWQVSATGGVGTYTYRWSYRLKGTTTWTVVGTGSSYSRAVNASDPDFDLMVLVTSANIIGSNTKSVDVGATPVAVVIEGPTWVWTAGTNTWNANATGGNGTYTYQWQYRAEGTTTWYNGGTASSYSRYLGPGDSSLELRVIVTSGGATATSDVHPVTVAAIPDCGNQPCN